jgi:hypothetical protein
MGLLRQYINGNWVNTLNVEASADDLNSIKSLLEGRIEEWDKKAEGGTKTDMPSELKGIKIAVGKEGEGKSTSFRLHHIDSAKNSDDVKSAIVGKFDVGYYDGAEKCDYARLIGIS